MTTRALRLILCGSCLVVAIIQVGMLNRDSTSGEHLSETIQQISLLQKENDFLHQQIASHSALTVVASRLVPLELDNPLQTLTFTSLSPVVLAQNPSL